MNWGGKFRKEGKQKEKLRPFLPAPAPLTSIVYFILLKEVLYMAASKSALPPSFPRSPLGTYVPGTRRQNQCPQHAG